MSQEGFPDGIHVVEVGQKQLQNSISGIDWPRLAKSKNVSRQPLLWLLTRIPENIFGNTFVQNRPNLFILRRKIDQKYLLKD